MIKTEYGLELETTEEVDVFINAIEKSKAWNIESGKINSHRVAIREPTNDDIRKFFSKGTDKMRTKDGKILILIDENYQKVQLSPNRIYFLSHPCTSGGEGEKTNREKEEGLYQFLVAECKNVKVIRPLKIIPDNYNYDKAMQICFKELEISDIVIFSPGFQTSRGCKDEHKYCINNGISRLYIVSEDVSKITNSGLKII